MYLGCGYNKLTNLPTLPDSLEGLDCNENKLTSLPTLPDNLTDLNCDYNELTSLPKLPNNLRVLMCTGNKLISLPILPDSLEQLNCRYNNLPKAFYMAIEQLNEDDNTIPYMDKIRLIVKKLNLQKNLKSHITESKRGKFALNLGTHKNNPLHRFAMKNIANYMNKENIEKFNTNSLKPSNVEFRANKTAARTRKAHRQPAYLNKKEKERLEKKNNTND